MKNDSLLKINDILKDYSEEVIESIFNEAEKVSEEAKNELIKSSPKKTGKYAKGWKVKKIIRTNNVDFVVYNSTKPMLTHLLEKPHLKRNGGRTKPKVHIKPVEEKYCKKIVDNTIRIIQNGG